MIFHLSFKYLMLLVFLEGLFNILQNMKTCIIDDILL